MKQVKDWRSLRSTRLLILPSAVRLCNWRYGKADVLVRPREDPPKVEIHSMQAAMWDGPVSSKLCLGAFTLNQ